MQVISHYAGVPGLVLCIVASLCFFASAAALVTVREDVRTTSEPLDGVLEVTMDIGTLTDGTHCNFSDPVFANLVSHLNVTLLRVGGTEGDFTYYDMQNNRTMTNPPPPFTRLLRADVWDDFARFSQRVGYRLLFGLNAGPFVRGADGVWNETMAKAFIQRNERQFAGLVAGYEFGNEPDLYFAVFDKEHYATNATQWARDMQVVRQVVQDYAAPGTKTICCDVAYQPVVGALGWFYDEFVQAGGLESTDIVTWHYYMLFGPKANRVVPAWLDPWSANPTRLAQPSTLDEIIPWAEQVRYDVTNKSTTLWLGETGSACFGGQLNVSNVWVDALAMVDKAGLITQRGHTRLFRQELCATHWTDANNPNETTRVYSPPYALIDKNLVPRPSYFIMTLFRRLVGESAVLTQSSNTTSLRAYAYLPRPGLQVQHANRSAVLTVTLINTLPTATNGTLCLNASQRGGTFSSDVYILSGCEGGLTSADVCVDDQRWVVTVGGAPQLIRPRALAWWRGESCSVGGTMYAYTTHNALHGESMWFVVL